MGWKEKTSVYKLVNLIFVDENYIPPINSYIIWSWPELSFCIYDLHCVKSVLFRTYSGLYSVPKIRTRITLNRNTFHPVKIIVDLLKLTVFPWDSRFWLRSHSLTVMHKIFMVYLHLRWFFSLVFVERRTLRSETIFDNWSPLKMMKNAFYFTLKSLFVVKIFKFLSWIFGHVEKTARLGS